MFYIRVYGTFLWHATVGRFFENIVHNYYYNKLKCTNNYKSINYENKYSEK